MARVDAVRGTLALTGVDACRAGAVLGLTVRAGWTVWFGAAPALAERGIVLRVRRDERGHEQSAVRVLAARRSRLGPAWAALRGTRDHRFRLDLDRTAADALVAVLDARLAPGSIRAGRVVTRLQRRFLAECAGLPVAPDDLVLADPLRLARCAPVRWHSYDVAAAWWTRPGGDVLELGMRVPRPGAEVVWRGFRSRFGREFPDAGGGVDGPLWCA